MDMQTGNDKFYEELKNNKFKQQTYAQWRPKPTMLSTTITYIFFGVCFMVMGGFVMYFSNRAYLHTEDYTNLQSNSISFKVEKDVKGPIMVSYELHGFYQNHREYIDSRNDEQLSGNHYLINKDELSISCKGVEKIKDLKKVMGKGTIYNLNGNELDDEEAAIPCGLFAATYFNDTFEIKNKDQETIKIDRTNIAWESDIEKFKNTKRDDWKEIQWIDMTDESFIVWMRPSVFPSFRKLYGKIESDLKAGEYFLEIKSEYDVARFKGRKLFVLSTINWLGGKNMFLGVSCLIAGSLSIIVALVFNLGYKYYEKHKDD